MSLKNHTFDDNNMYVSRALSLANTKCKFFFHLGSARRRKMSAECFVTADIKFFSFYCHSKIILVTGILCDDSLAQVYVKSTFFCKVRLPSFSSQKTENVRALLRQTKHKIPREIQVSSRWWFASGTREHLINGKLWQPASPKLNILICVCKKPYRSCAQSSEKWYFSSRSRFVFHEVKLPSWTCGAVFADMAAPPPASLPS